MLALILATILLLSGSGPRALAEDGNSIDTAIAQRIEDLLELPAARRTHWGILVRDLDTGATVFERNPGKLFVPASNVKLFSTAMALRRLGPGYRFATVLAATGTVDGEGVLQGDLRLVGGGDPNLSSRTLPYRKPGDFEPDRLAPLRDLARQLREAGIRRVAGDLVGDDSRYVWQPYPRGWGYADTLQAYGSPASALVFNDNLIEVLVRPGAANAAARLDISPALGYYEFSNRTATVRGRFVNRSLSARWGELPGQVVLTGQIPVDSRGRKFQFAADDPARYAALAFKATLASLGIEVAGDVVARHSLPEQMASLRSIAPSQSRDQDARLAETGSAQIAEAIRVVNKDSQNLHAEMLMREVALQESGVGSREAAVENLRRFLAEAGLRTGEFALHDGSGLSRHNLVAPVATVRLLEYMWHSEDREVFLDSLPVAGHDGTLDWRFQRGGARGRIRAKTGSMSHVLALSGYAEGADGATYAFSILANNFGMASSSTRKLVDSIATALVLPGSS